MLVSSLVFSVGVTVVLGYCVLVLVGKYLKFRQRVIVVSKIPGPKTEFLFGNARDLPGLSEAALAYLRDEIKSWPKLVLGWLGPFMPNVNVIHPDTVKLILRTSGLSEKGMAFMRDQMTIRPKMGLTWLGPFMPTVNVVHPDTVKRILRTSGLSEAGLAYMREQMAIRPKLSLIWQGAFMPTINVIHPDTVKLLLRTSEPKSPMIYGLIKSWLGEGLLVSNGQQWARSRRLLTPAFHFDILKKYHVVQNKAADVLVGKLSHYADHDEYFEVFENVCLFSLDTIMQCAFSYQSDCQTEREKNPYIQAVQDMSMLMSKRFFKFWLYNDFIYWLTSDGRKWFRACDFVHNVSEKVIADRRKALERESKPGVEGQCKDFRGILLTAKDEDGVGMTLEIQYCSLNHERDSKPGVESQCKDFLGILLTAKDEDGVGMTPLEIRNEVDTFMFEGHDTTTSGISWILYAIAKHPDIQRKIHEEIDEVMQDRDSNDIFWDDIPKLQYLTLVIKESLRMNPPVVFIQRQTTEPLSLEGHEVPPGTLINIVLYSVLNNHTVWENSQEFIPERFLLENMKDMDPYSYVPFSAGPRNCIGQNFAMNEMKTVVAKILRRFTLELDPNHKVERLMSVVLRSTNGIRMKATRRQPN